MDETSFKSMFRIADELGQDVFEQEHLVQLKRLATVYDFALDLDYPDVMTAAESKVAEFLSAAIDGAGDDEDKADAIRDIAAAMVELREHEEKVIAEREKREAEEDAAAAEAEGEGDGGAVDRN